MIRGQLLRGASSFVTRVSWKQDLASKAKGKPAGGKRARTRAAEENKVPSTIRQFAKGMPSKLKAVGAASIRPQHDVPIPPDMLEERENGRRPSSYDSLILKFVGPVVRLVVSVLLSNPSVINSRLE